MSSPILGVAVDGGRAVPINLQRLLVTRLLLQANSGAGKSWALRRILEQTHGQVPQVVFDVDEEFHTLREKFPYVLAGQAGADCRADLKTAPVLARRILEHGFSTIISISELKAHERGAFVRLFLESLMSAKRALWRPLLVVVDEAHLFCPEKDKSQAAGAVIDLMTRGRKRGFCGLLATQRISKLNKDAAAEANNKLIGRAALDLDMKRAADELGFSGREQQHQLRTLPDGEFFAFGPALSGTVLQVRVGKVHTTHPEPGDRGAHTPPPAPAQMKAILAKLADLPKDAEQEVDELQRLRGRVAELERAQRAAPVAAAKATNQEIQAAYAKGQEEGRSYSDLQLLQELQVQRNRIEGAVDLIKRDLSIVSHNLGVIASAAVALENLRTAKTTTEIRKPPLLALITGEAEARRIAKAHLKTQAPTARADGAVPTPQQRILDALAWLDSVGIHQAEKVQLALLADASPKSSGYANNLGALRSSGLIEYPAGGQVALTGEGRGLARIPPTPPTTADLHATLEEKLPRPQFRILNVLIDCYPKDMDRAQLAEEAEQSPNSSGFSNNLGALRSLGFIDYPAPGRVAAKPVLFLDSRGAI